MSDMNINNNQIPQSQLTQSVSQSQLSQNVKGIAPKTVGDNVEASATQKGTVNGEMKNPILPPPIPKATTPTQQQIDNVGEHISVVKNALNILHTVLEKGSTGGNPFLSSSGPVAMAIAMQEVAQAEKEIKAGFSKQQLKDFEGMLEALKSQMDAIVQKGQDSKDMYNKLGDLALAKGATSLTLGVIGGGMTMRAGGVNDPGYSKLKGASEITSGFNQGLSSILDAQSKYAEGSGQAQLAIDDAQVERLRSYVEFIKEKRSQMLEKIKGNQDNIDGIYNNLNKMFDSIYQAIRWTSG